MGMEQSLTRSLGCLPAEGPRETLTQACLSSLHPCP